MKKILFFMLFLNACSPKIDEQGFDKQTWKNDKNACQELRKTQVSVFEEKIKPQLLFQSESTVREVLGKPDRTEAAQRGQRFYIYFVEKGKACQDELPEATFLQVRIDALGRASEIVLIRK